MWIIIVSLVSFKIFLEEHAWKIIHVQKFDFTHPSTKKNLGQKVVKWKIHNYCFTEYHFTGQIGVEKWCLHSSEPTQFLFSLQNL